MEKAHVTCGNWDASDHDLCGYWLEAAPDHYVNEEWFGITAPRLCATSINALRPRQARHRPERTNGPCRCVHASAGLC